MGRRQPGEANSRSGWLGDPVSRKSQLVEYAEGMKFMAITVSDRRFRNGTGTVRAKPESIGRGARLYTRSQYLHRSLTKNGSPQESVRPPGFIGFSRFGADGLTGFHGSGSESSPMFTNLSARSCVDRRGRRKSPVSFHADDRHGSNKSANASVGSSSARQLDRMVRWFARDALGRSNCPEDTVK